MKAMKEVQAIDETEYVQNRKVGKPRLCWKMLGLKLGM